MKAKRVIGIDMLKCLAIVAVVLYHLGLLQIGYVGVELFFCYRWLPNIFKC